MSSQNPTSKLDKILADAQRNRETSYREKALKMYPHICGRCGREFAGKRLMELTVHHRDHNHDNHPEAGTDRELPCFATTMNTSVRSMRTTRLMTPGAAVPARPSTIRLPIWLRG